MNPLRSLFAVIAMVLVVGGPVPAIAGAIEPPFALTPGSFATTISTTQAGAHPDLTTEFALEHNAGFETFGGTPKDLNVVLPRGLIGAANATPTCPMGIVAQLPPAGGPDPCPRNTAVGEAFASIKIAGGGAFASAQRVLIYSVTPDDGEPAAFGFFALYPVRIDTAVRPDGDYGVTASVFGLTEAATILASKVTFWGVPADHAGPGPMSTNVGVSYGGPSGDPRVPFITNPTECSGSPLTSAVAITTWQQPTQTASASYSFGPLTGCDQLEFKPTLDAQPTTNLADAPSGLDFNLHIPQHKGPFAGADEVQLLEVVAPLGGQFRLGFGGDTTADLPFDAEASEVRSALENLPTIGVGGVSVARREFGSLYAITFEGPLGNSDVAQLTAENGTEPLQFGSASVSTLRNGEPGSSEEELSTAHLRDARVALPSGMSVNPSSANGLEACSMAQVGISAAGKPDGSPVTCPDASRLGTLEAVTPVLDHPLGGSVYLAAQNANPFGSLLALYLVVDDPKTGILVKIPAKVQADPVTGQLTTRIAKSPDLPIEDVNLHLFKGDRAALRTPSACGTYTTTSTLTPWTSPAGADATPQSSFQIAAGPRGGACLPSGAQAPNQPTFTAGTLTPTAGAFSPFVMKLTRADGSQPISSIDATLPKGLLGRLTGIPYCSDSALASAVGKTGKAEQASPSCPAASQVGTVTVGAGAGPTPFYAPGKAYLAGSYRGAPLSLAIVTPAVAGPFDLGTVVVRAALDVDPLTTQIHAVSDPIPTILQGIPLDIRSIDLRIDKPSFTLNPTNCNPSAVLGGATSVFGQIAAFSSRFQVGDCAALKFKPSVKLSLKGETKRTGNPALTAVVKLPAGQANIAKTAVLLPATEFIDNRHINNPCTRVQFVADACPKSSILGTATAYTPLLDQPLTGPVYFRSNGGERELPDMVVDLNGQIHVTLVGFIDSVGKKGSEKRRARTRFQSIPDAPVSRFVLKLFGGKRGLIQNSVNVCTHPGQATVQMEAQNADTNNFDTPFAARCGKSKKHPVGKKKSH